MCPNSTRKLNFFFGLSRHCKTRAQFGFIRRYQSARMRLPRVGELPAETSTWSIFLGIKYFASGLIQSQCGHQRRNNRYWTSATKATTTTKTCFEQRQEPEAYYVYKSCEIGRSLLLDDDQMKSAAHVFFLSRVQICQSIDRPQVKQTDFIIFSPNLPH